MESKLTKITVKGLHGIMTDVLKVETPQQDDVETQTKEGIERDLVEINKIRTELLRRLAFLDK